MNFFKIVKEWFSCKEICRNYEIACVNYKKSCESYNDTITKAIHMIKNNDNEMDVINKRIDGLVKLVNKCINEIHEIHRRLKEPSTVIKEVPKKRGRKKKDRE